MASAAGDFRLPIQMVTFAADLRFARSKVGRRMRVWRGVSGLVREGLLIPRVGRRRSRRLLPMALRTFQSRSLMSLDQ